MRFLLNIFILIFIGFFIDDYEVKADRNVARFK